MIQINTLPVSIVYIFYITTGRKKINNKKHISRGKLINTQLFNPYLSIPFGFYPLVSFETHIKHICVI